MLTHPPKPDIRNDRSRRHLPALRLLVSVPLVCLIAGCSSQPSREAIPAQPLAAQNRTASPAVWGADRGLELISWIVADPKPPRPVKQARKHESEGEDGALDSEQEERVPFYTIVDHRLSIEAALARYVDRPIPLGDDVRFRWHAAGLRIVAVPTADLAAIQKSLRLVGPTQRQWLGEMPSWTDLVRGPAFSTSRTVAAENGQTQLEPGRLRMLARSWIAPDPRGRTAAGGFPRAALRLEMVPQHEPQLSEPHRLLAGVSSATAEAQGRIFPRLSLGLYLEPDDALIIIPDSPESDWSEKLAAEPVGDDGRHGSERAEARQASLGEAMLATPASGTTPRTRAVIVLIPHTPQRYELR